MDSATDLAGVRQRNFRSTTSVDEDVDVHVKKTGRGKQVNSVGVVDVLRILGGLFLLNCLLSYFVTNDSVLWGWRPWFVRPNVVMRYWVRLQSSSAAADWIADTSCSKDQYTSRTPSWYITTEGTPTNPSTSPLTAPSTTSPPAAASTVPEAATTSSPAKTPPVASLQAVSQKTAPPTYEEQSGHTFPSTSQKATRLMAESSQERRRRRGSRLCGWRGRRSGIHLRGGLRCSRGRGERSILRLGR